MQGFLKCFLRELAHAGLGVRPLAHRASKSRFVAAFVAICSCSSHSHLPTHCPGNHLSEPAATLHISVFAFPVSACLLFICSGAGRAQKQECRNVAKLIVVSESQGCGHFSLRQQLLKYTEWNLGVLARPPPPESVRLLPTPGLCFLSIDVLLTLLPFNLPFYITSILLPSGFPISSPSSFMPRPSRSLRNNAIHLSDFFSAPCPT